MPNIARRGPPLSPGSIRVGISKRSWTGLTSIRAMRRSLFYPMELWAMESCILMETLAVDLGAVIKPPIMLIKAQVQ